MSECPSQHELVALINEDLAAGENARLSDHVEHCRECETRLIQLTSQPSDASLVRASRSNHERGEPSRQALDRISKQLANRFCVAIDTRHDVTTPTRLRVGLELEGYQLLDRIGSGGMGTVYRARHVRLDRTVAIKVLDADQFPGTRRIDRFRRESQAIGRLKHPNVVHAQHAGECGQFHYLVMEYVRGFNLDQLVRRLGPLRVSDACELIRQAAVGLQHCHQAGLVHRDVKPSNIMLSQESGSPVVKVLDLGLARFTEVHVETLTDLTREDSVVGTIDFMAPEQFGGETVDIRADVYALGATLFTIIAGQSPYASNGSNLLERIARRSREAPRSLAELPISVPRSLVSLVDRMLAIGPDERPATPGDVAQALQPFCDGHALDRLVSITTDGHDERIVVHPNSIEPRDDSIATQRDARETDTSSNQSPPRRRAALALSFVAIGFLAAAGLATWFTNQGTIVVSADQKVLVELVRDHSSAEQFEVGPEPKRIWSRAGDYEIWIPEQPHERILVTNQRFSLGTGGSKNVVINIEPSPSLDVDPAENPTEDPGRSYDLTRTGVVLLLRNESPEPVDCFAVSFQGEPWLYCHLEPGETASAGAAHGHLFRFQQSGQIEAFYVTRNILDQTCVISDSPDGLAVLGEPTAPLELDARKYFHIESKRLPGKVLSMRGGASANVGLDHRFDTNNQLFRFVPAGDDWYFIESKLQSEMVLTIVKPELARQANLLVLPRIGEGTSAQRFRVFPAEEGHIRIVSALGKLFHLTLAGDEDDVVPGIYVGDATTFKLIEY